MVSLQIITKFLSDSPFQSQEFQHVGRVSRCASGQSPCDSITQGYKRVHVMLDILYITTALQHPLLICWAHRGVLFAPLNPSYRFLLSVCLTDLEAFSLFSIPTTAIPKSYTSTAFLFYLRLFACLDHTHSIPELFKLFSTDRGSNLQSFFSFSQHIQLINI